MIVLFLTFILKNIRASCPQPSTSFNFHDISKDGYSFEPGKYIYGCHLYSERISSNDCTLHIYACIFNSINAHNEGGAIYLSITIYSLTPSSLNFI